MIKTIINGSGESVAYTDRLEFDTPTSNVDVYMLASVDPISPPDAREWDFTVDIPNESISTLPNGYTIMIADTREAIENGHNYKLLFRKSEYNGIEHYRVKVNAPFYIGVGNTDTPIPLSDLSIYTVETFYNFSFAFSILGNSEKCILYKGDMEPCALYVNGERQDALSYSTRSVNGSNSVQYASKYKNNLRTLSFSGNTEQAQYRGVNMFNINAPLLASPFSVEAIAKPKIENGIIYSGGYNESTLGGIDGCFLFVATDGDGDYTFSFNANCTAIESGMRFRIVGAEDVDGTTYDTGPWDYLSAPAEITGNGKYTLTVDNNGYSYIGIAFYSPTRYNIVVTNLQIEKGSVATAYEPYVYSSVLPSEYQEVEYIKSTGTQYIDTGVIPTIDTTVEIELMSDTDNVFPYGSRTSSTTNDKHCVLLNLRSLNVYALMGNSSADASFFKQYLNPCKIKNGKDGFYINGDLARDYGDITFSASSLNLYLFALNSPNEAYATRAFVGNIYSCKIYEGNNIIRDYIPCYRKADNVIGLYDLANGVFYTNSGTGTFLKGNDADSPIAPTIASPQLISNCGNSQVDVTLRGTNLFDIDNPLFVASTSSVLNNLKPKIENGIIYSGGKLGDHEGAYICVKTDKASVYTFSFDADFDEVTQVSRNLRYVKFNTFSNGVFSSPQYSGYYAINKGKNSITIASFGYEYIGVATFSNSQYGMEFTNFQIKKGDVATPYEPYFNTTVSIPANTALESGANDTLLELAGLGDVKDTITIDRVNNKVKYTQRICRVRPFVNVGGTLSYGGGGGSNTHDLWTFSLNKWSKMPETVVCEFARVLNEDNYTSLGATEFGVFFVYEDYIYIYIPKSLGINSTQALEDYLTLTNSWGVSLFYALDEPVEWDLSLTNKELNDNLLSWARGTKNLTNIIEITATPSAQDASASYAMWEESNANNT